MSGLDGITIMIIMTMLTLLILGLTKMVFCLFMNLYDKVLISLANIGFSSSEEEKASGKSSKFIVFGLLEL